MSDTHHHSHSLDPLRLPLQGALLIEASAGTGKTFTIAALYLRLLLGLDATRQCAYNVTQLLVVTFTEAATQELRGRIRASIHGMRLACLQGGSDNALYQSLLAEIADLPQAAHCLLLAEQQMDEAAIFTIHGFCQRMLSLNAFESGMPFQQKIIEDETPLRQIPCADFWRRCCYPLPAAIAVQINQYFTSPLDLLQTISPFFNGRAPQIIPGSSAGETLTDRHQRITHLLEVLKVHWLKESANIASLITESGVNKQSYKRNNLADWIAKIDAWASQPVNNYQLPASLERFRQSVLMDKSKDNPPILALFSEIDKVCDDFLSLIDLLVDQALNDINIGVAQHKRKRGELGFDDMLSRLDNALSSADGAMLAQAIREQFPVAMIDEFQDTDPLQYRIFKRIWQQASSGALLLIGDPKQAIYAFRGADVFTYMQARNEVTAHYTLETNWRSSPAMIASVNHLFTTLATPFVYQDIPFTSVRPAEKNQSLRFVWRGGTQPAMRFWLLESTVNAQDYTQQMAQICAGQIRDWLEGGLRGEALLYGTDGERPLQAADITVLVRNRTEAALIRDALNVLAIPSVYLSNHDSVFSTPSANELLWILHAALTPERETVLRRAVSASLLGFDTAYIDTLNQDETVLEQLVEDFIRFRQTWWHSGVMAMLHQLVHHYRIAESLLATLGGERHLTDLLHLGELLQETAGKLDNPHALVRWLERQIHDPGNAISSQQLRLESDKHLVQIATIHKAKGLEYSLVCLPFIALSRKIQRAVYHDRGTAAIVWDLSNQQASKERAKREQLAEDLRLLYVALTRAIWHCSIGIAPLHKKTDKSNSAIGTLIQRDAEQDAEGLRRSLSALCNSSGGCMVWQSPPPDDLRRWQSPPSVTRQLAARQMHRVIADNWRVTSYSGLQRHTVSQPLELPGLDLDAVNDNEVVNNGNVTTNSSVSLHYAGTEPVVDSADDQISITSAEEIHNIHTFPRGADPGTFLHSLLEQLDFTKPVVADWLTEQLQQAGFEHHWQPMLSQWLTQLLNMPLNQQNLTLNQLAPADKITELAFWLPINVPLQAPVMDALIRHYDPLSVDCPPLDFRTLRGMLKGFIDLVFRWQGRYYLLDYKSNWLGDNHQAYSQQAMCQAMRTHRYDLQYQLYSLALHRYLRHRLTGYQYQQHFGGVIYLFLRGVSPIGGYGVYQTCLPAEAIAALDNLFAGAGTDTA